MTYQELLERKRIKAREFGIEPKDIHPELFDFQRKATEFAIRKGRAALFLDTGLGKTICQLEWARQIPGEVLILAPVAVAPQTVREAKDHLGMDVHHSRDGSVSGKVTITNYERLHLFDAQQFAGVVLDECFAPDTQVESFQDGACKAKEIRHIRPGEKIINASGIDTVRECHRRKVTRAYAVSFAGRRIIASENHPWFTQRGWVPSRKLWKTDRLLETAEAMRMVRKGFCAEDCANGQSAILREVLLSEMAYESAGDCCQGALQGGAREDWKEGVEMAENDGIRQGQRATVCIHQADAMRRNSGESEPHIESDEAQTFRAWRKREGIDCTAIAALGGVTEWMGERVCLITGSKGSRLSNLLQNGSCESEDEDGDRSGWIKSSLAQDSGCEEGCKSGFIRLDCIEALERGHPDLERFANSDGDIYFYDIGLTRHPSFTVNGALVHNSSILKSFSGKTKQQLCQTFAQTPYRLACTATPAPNDYMELGNHAEFLGIMPQGQMLARWFINDTANTGDWRLKGHAVESFWEWVATWAVCASKPSDLGGDDTRYILPPLTQRVHVVQVERPPNIETGFLFGHAELSATNIHADKRATLEDRVAKAVELSQTGDHCLIWCESNAESEALAKAIPGAVEVVGSDDADKKAEAAEWFCGYKCICKTEECVCGFKSGGRTLISKSSIFGFGLNFQHCNHVIFSSLSYSYESFYQAIRRTWRFGQKRPVHVDAIIADSEQGVWRTVKEKMDNHELMKSAMRAASKIHQAT